METKSLKALALKVLQRNQRGNFQETEKKTIENSEGVKISLKTAPETNLYTQQDNDTRTIEAFQFDDPYWNKYIEGADGVMVMNMVCTHLKASSYGIHYRTVIPLTLDYPTGTIRIFDFGTFAVAPHETNQLSGLYSEDMIRIKGRELRDEEVC